MAYELIHDSSELRKLIAENPDLPIVVLAGEEAACQEFAWTYCAEVRCNLDVLLDTKTPYDGEHVFGDAGDFEDAVADALWFGNENLSSDEFAELVNREVEKYKPFWRKVIAIYATN